MINILIYEFDNFIKIFWINQKNKKIPRKLKIEEVNLIHRAFDHYFSAAKVNYKGATLLLIKIYNLI